MSSLCQQIVWVLWKRYFREEKLNQQQKQGKEEEEKMFQILFDAVLFGPRLNLYFVVVDDKVKTLIAHIGHLKLKRLGPDRFRRLIAHSSFEDVV